MDSGEPGRLDPNTNQFRAHRRDAYRAELSSAEVMQQR